MALLSQMYNIGGTSPGSMVFLPSDKITVTDGTTEYIRSGVLKLASSYPNFPDYLKLGVGYIFKGTTQPSTTFVSSATNNTTIVLMGSVSSSTAYWSDDGGITINTTSLPSSDNWGAVAYGNGFFLAISQTGKVAKSVNGKTWSAGTQVPVLSTIKPTGLTYGGGKFLVVGLAGKPHTTVDGLTWSIVNAFSQTQLISAVFDGNVFLTCYTGTSVEIWDGVSSLTLTRTLPTGTGGGGSYILAAKNGTTVAISSQGVLAGAVSADGGDSWVTITPPATAYQNVCSVNYVNNKFYLSSASGVYVSATGVDWSKVALPKEIPSSHVVGIGQGNTARVTVLNPTGTVSANSDITLNAIGSPVYTPTLYLRIK